MIADGEAARVAPRATRELTRRAPSTALSAQSWLSLYAGCTRSAGKNWQRRLLATRDCSQSYICFVRSARPNIIPCGLLGLRSALLLRHRSSSSP